MDKPKAFKLLKTYLGEIDHLRSLTYEDEESKLWKNKVNTVLEAAFGKESDEYKWLNSSFVITSFPRTQTERQEDYLYDLDTYKIGIKKILQKYEILGIPTNPEKELSKQVNTKLSSEKKQESVFVVHGRNEDARLAMFTFLRSIGLEPLEWSEAIKLTCKAAPYIGEVLDVAFSCAQAIVVLLTGDDLARLDNRFMNSTEKDETLTPQARPNVIFEAGLAFGRNPDRTLLVQLGPTRPISDLAGRHSIIINNSIKKRQELASRLKTAGCAVQIEYRTDWHVAGDFDKALVTPDKPETVKNTVSEQGIKSDFITAQKQTPKVLITRVLPASVSPGQLFDVIITFTAQANDFNAVGISDNIPPGWSVAANKSWCTPAAMESRVSGQNLEYVWGGPYNKATSFTAKYKVTVPSGASPGNYGFSGSIEYYIGESGPRVGLITGMSNVKVRMP